MTLVEKQNEFTAALIKLLTWMQTSGYQVTLGEAYRPEWVAKQYAKRNCGIANSLHTKRLAIDLNLFFNGTMLTGYSDYKSAGEYWVSLSTPDLTFCWGGDFSPPDSDHFSLESDGVR